MQSAQFNPHKGKLARYVFACMLVWCILFTILAPQVFAELSPSAHPSSISGKIFAGVNAHIWDLELPQLDSKGYFDMMSRMGVKWVRLDAVDPFNEWDVARFGPFLSALHSINAEVLVILSNNVVGNNASFTVSDWNNSVRAFVELFGAQVDAWEIWNEPNYPQFFLGYMDGSPEHYVEMLKSAYSIIKLHYPDIPVIFGGLAPTNNALAFTQRAFDLGAGTYCDAYAYHVYSLSSEADTDLKAAISTMYPKPVWITETGADSLQLGPEGQAEQLRMLGEYLQRNREIYRIQLVFWYCWVDYAKVGADRNVFGNHASNEDFFGLVTVNLTPKPAYYEYLGRRHIVIGPS